MEIYLPRVIAVVVTLLVATPVASVWKGPSQVVNVRSPFTATVTFQALEPDFITIRFTVLPLPGASAHPLSAVFSAAYLLRSGRVKPTGLSSGFRRVDLPIFGLYPNISNTVDVEVAHPRSVAAAFTVTIATPGWTGPFAITSRIDVVPRNGVKLDFSYFMVTGVASADGPVIMDVDGYPRWTGFLGAATTGFALIGTKLYYDQSKGGHHRTSKLFSVSLDGIKKPVSDLAYAGFVGFHHMYTLGKQGLLVQVHNNAEDGFHREASVAELDLSGRLLRLWDLAVIFRQHMAAAGDDANASKFVRNDVDWCHANSVHYWAAQDTIVVSCRESFVVGIGYTDSSIKWILGHASKMWFQFPSLQAVALTLAPGSEAPIGQHSVTVTPAGELLLFDNGLASLSSTNVPAGVSRNVSFLRKYHIDPSRKLASEVWRYSHTKAPYSSVCSSVYQEGNSYLVDYAHVNGPNGFLHLVGLDANSTVAFDFKYAGDCWNAWNAKILHLGGLVFK